MPKIKVPRKSIAIDMTAMCDVAFLLLTFFILTTKFKPDEAVVVDPPSSVSDIKIPESDVLHILIDKDSRVFFGLDGQNVREALLDKMGKRYNITFSDVERKKFSLLTTFGLPVQNLKQFLSLDPTQRAKVNQPGIPCDSTNNELGDWIHQARLANKEVRGKELRIAIKGDMDAGFPQVKRVIDTFVDKKVTKLNFVTSLENAPQITVK